MGTTGAARWGWQRGDEVTRSAPDRLFLTTLSAAGDVTHTAPSGLNSCRPQGRDRLARAASLQGAGASRDQPPRGAGPPRPLSLGCCGRLGTYCQPSLTGTEQNKATAGAACHEQEATHDVGKKRGPSGLLSSVLKGVPLGWGLHFAPSEEKGRAVSSDQRSHS